MSKSALALDRRRGAVLVCPEAVVHLLAVDAVGDRHYDIGD
jgi:hypothetical protein